MRSSSPVVMPACTSAASRSSVNRTTRATARKPAQSTSDVMDISGQLEVRVLDQPEMIAKRVGQSRNLDALAHLLDWRDDGAAGLFKVRHRRVDPVHAPVRDAP